MRDYDDGDTSDNALAGFTFNDNTDTLEVTDTLANGDTNTAENIAVASGGSLKLGGGVSVSSESTGVDAVAANGDISFDQNDGVPAEGSKITVANKTIAFYNSNSGNFDDADHAKTSLSADYVVDTYGITNGQGIAQAVVDEVNNDPISGYQVTVDGANADQVNVDATSTGVSGLSAGELVNSTAPTDTAATGSITFSDTPTEGSTVTIGNESIGFYDSTSGNYSDANEAKTELSTDYVIDINGKSTVNDIKDSVLALDPQMSQVNLADGGIGQIDITVASTGAAGNQVQLDSTENETTGFKTNFQIGANNGQSFQMDISDMRANALGVSGDTAGADHSSVAGAMFTSTQNVTNGTNNTATEYAMDVTTHDKASAAVEVVNDAIEQVSAQRSALGAYQNRLEHTINNLGTSAENLTSAESRIRDTDMAKEMMNFTKQNILSQAAQSMLAQANQMPQGVLKLLQ
ncbi:MAG: hypothetical protein K9L17_03525 [Clostridiales bacterium]|nr:hypothetical protein [Clostridiales bacterium]MCF8021750.1 hypothetical protein [Clostridiales bacterium]